MRREFKWTTDRLNVNKMTAVNDGLRERRLLEAGGNIQMARFDLYGHHPHGLDDPAPLADFIFRHYPGF